MEQTHPLARDPGAVRLLEHNLLDIEAMLGADSFSLDENEVVFRRRAAGRNPAMSWKGRLGDWLARDVAGSLQIVSDESATADPTLPGQVDSSARPSNNNSPATRRQASATS